MNLTGKGQHIDDIKNQLDLLDVNIDPDCKQWLATNLRGSFDDKIKTLILGVADSFLAGGKAQTSIAAAASEAGYDIIFNLQGAYFSSPTIGGLKNDFTILIHELAHLFNAPGFNNNDGEMDKNGNLTQAAEDAQKHNQDLIEEHCANTIH